MKAKSTYFRVLAATFFVAVSASLTVAQAQSCGAVYVSKGPRLVSEILNTEAKTAQGVSAKTTVFLSSESGFMKTVSMVEQAQRGDKLKMGYFIFENDFSTAFLVKKIIEASRRGVEVEILVDFLMTEKYQSWLQFMASHTGIKVYRFRPPTADFIQLLVRDLQIKSPEKLFAGLIEMKPEVLIATLMDSPVLQPHIVTIMETVQAVKSLAPEARPAYVLHRLLGIVEKLDPQWGVRFKNGIVDLTYRMHHKILLLEKPNGEGEALVGGRNRSDEYHLSIGDPFLANRNYPFFDAEVSVMLKGQSLARVSESVDRLNQSAVTLDIGRRLTLSNWKSQRQHMLDKSAEFEARLPEVQEKAKKGVFELGEKEYTYTENLPKEIIDRLAITENWSRMISEAKQQVTIVSAYFLFYPQLYNAVKTAAARGVKIDIYTNSFTSTDMNIVNVMSYKKFDQWTQDLGPNVRIFELNKQKGEGSLHAKMINVDNKAIGIGSVNADPRNNGIDSNNMIFVDTSKNPREAMDIFEAYTRADALFGLTWTQLTPENVRILREQILQADPKLDIITNIPFVQQQL